jgi:hypothetical protein
VVALASLRCSAWAPQIDPRQSAPLLQRPLGARPANLPIDISLVRCTSQDVCRSCVVRPPLPPLWPIRKDGKLPTNGQLPGFVKRLHFGGDILYAKVSDGGSASDRLHLSRGRGRADRRPNFRPKPLCRPLFRRNSTLSQPPVGGLWQAFARLGIWGAAAPQTPRSLFGGAMAAARFEVRNLIPPALPS